MGDKRKLNYNYMTKEQAVSNLQSLIDVCVARGGIFNKWQEAAGMIDSLTCLYNPKEQEEKRGIEKAITKFKPPPPNIEEEKLVMKERDY